MILLNAGSVWLINDKQELRVRLEAIGLDAKADRRIAWRPDGEPVRIDETDPEYRPAQPRLPDPLPLRTRAAVVPVRRLRARR